MQKNNELQRENIDFERSMSVLKRDDMIQKARHKLSVQEQRAVLYAISKIKPTDTYLTEYTFDIKDFYKIIGWEKQSYTELKTLLKGLSDKSWWAQIDDNGTESVLRWFTTVRSNKNSGKVTIKFHEDVMPFLIEIKKGEFYTHYNLKYVLPMSSQYSPRLYELLKSYQKNNKQWFFTADKLKQLLSCEHYKRWPDFQRRALDPAVEEINKYTDIQVKYILHRQGQKVVKITFLMDNKTIPEMYEVNNEIDIALDGQLSLFAALDSEETKAKTEFVKERAAAHREERELGKKA